MAEPGSAAVQLCGQPSAAVRYSPWTWAPAAAVSAVTDNGKWYDGAVSFESNIGEW